MKYVYFFFAFALLSSCTERKNFKFSIIHQETDESNYRTKEVFELHAKGNKELEDGNFKEAKEFFISALEDDSRNKIILNDLGITEAQLGNYESSIENLKKVLSIDSMYIEGYINLSLSFILKGDFDQALKMADHAIKSTEETKFLCGAYANKALAEFKLKDYDQALKDIDRAIELCEEESEPRRLKRDIERNIVEAKNKEELKEKFKERE